MQQVPKTVFGDTQRFLAEWRNVRGEEFVRDTLHVRRRPFVLIAPENQGNVLVHDEIRPVVDFGGSRGDKVLQPKKANHQGAHNRAL